MRIFTLSNEQYKKYVEWREVKEKEPYCGAAGGCYSFIFIPTGLGTIVKVTCTDGTKLDLTEWDNW